AGLAGLNDDWRGFHEFAHLLIPFPGRDDIWFSEGFASYYQHLLQSRTGILAPDEAWRRIMAGFRRGLDDPAGRGRTLSELSPRMRRERAYRRVYWTGAAFFLRVDTRLRAATAHRLSLDAALASYHACCMRRTRGPDAAALVRELGRTGLPRIWREEWKRTLEGPAEPRFGNALDLLGIRADGDGWILDGDAEARRMRAAIAAPRARDQARGYFSAE
ncbi:MAG: hypothetical protein R3323_07800, partial [Wenzhouxiangellaceae bacterium]|nr:hypothetical protein [Wenzhouxiangellaceae bacterium]